jgi:hypothetical protein
MLQAVQKSGQALPNRSAVRCGSGESVPVAQRRWDRHVFAAVQQMVGLSVLPAVQWEVRPKERKLAIVGWQHLVDGAQCAGDCGSEAFGGRF